MKALILRRVVGNSMSPSIRAGQIVIASGLNKYKKGSIVIAKVDNREVIKRVKSIKNNKIWLVGDNKKFSTDSRKFGWVSPSQIIGCKL